MAATRKDVAKLAGVSTATVSYVFNNNAAISEKTREKVLAAASELNYIPNQIARSLTTTSSRQLSVILDNIKNPYYGEIVSLFEKYAIEKGYFVNVCTKPQYLDTYFTNILSRQIDGLMLMVVPDEALAKKIKIIAQQIPVAASGYFTKETDMISLVDPDFETGMLKAVKYLSGYGHKRIVYLSCFERDCLFDTRVACFEAACESVFGKYNAARVYAPEHGNMISNDETGYKLTESLLQDTRDFTAVITTGDLMAIGCMAAMKDNGVRTPQDVSIMGIDGIEMGDYMRPALTTLALDKERLAQNALDSILDRIAGKPVIREKTGFSILERQSVVQCSG